MLAQARNVCIAIVEILVPISLLINNNFQNGISFEVSTGDDIFGGGDESKQLNDITSVILEELYFILAQVSWSVEMQFLFLFNELLLLIQFPDRLKDIFEGELHIK